MKLTAYIEDNKAYIESLLLAYMEGQYGGVQPVYDAMTYSLMAGGKRLRPMILLETYRLFREDSDRIRGFISAIEMIHTYSLIHDDLPAMDNDDLRRGKPTCHVAYGEDMAILAGDGLLNKAYEVMTANILDEGLGQAGLKAMDCLARKAGTGGMVGGQVVDILNENTELDMATLLYIHEHKTSALLEASFMMGAYLGGGDEEAAASLELVGRHVGLAFQIQDDVLDVTSTDDKLGKPIGSDRKNAKTTYIDLAGLEQARADVKAHLDQAETLVTDTFGDRAGFVRALIDYIRNREH